MVLNGLENNLEWFRLAKNGCEWFRMAENPRLRLRWHCGCVVAALRRRLRPVDSNHWRLRRHCGGVEAALRRRCGGGCGQLAQILTGDGRQIARPPSAKSRNRPPPRLAGSVAKRSARTVGRQVRCQAAKLQNRQIAKPQNCEAAKLRSR